MRRLSIIVALLAVLVPALVRGQDVNVQTYQPSPHPQDYFSVRGTETLGHLNWAVGLHFNYARNPLLTRRDNGDIFRRAVSDMLTADLQFTLGVLSFMEFAVELPVHPYIGGDGFAAGREPNSGALGDIRVSPRFRILDHGGNGFGLAAEGVLGIPVGKFTDRYTGDRNVTFTPQLMAEYKMPLFRVAFDIGYRFAEEANLGNLQSDDELTYGLGLGVKPATEYVEILAEVFGAAGVNSLTKANERQLEALLGLKIFPGAGLTINAGGGAGVLPGYGTPQWRVFAGIAFSPRVPTDEDNDRLFGREDGCPSEAEDLDGFQDQDGCPDPDNDNDSILDADDPCPNVAEDLDGFEDQDGCPEPDNDGDGILDASDGCPNVAEDVDGFEDQDGCPEPDNDGDGILDATDKCPNAPENKNNCEDEDGCPEERLVCITPRRLVTLEPIYFVFGKATLQERSTPVLLDVAKVMREHRELLRIRIEGHTDDVGADRRNLVLSKRRAEAVYQFLVGQGISPARLNFRGFGESEPLVPNTSDENRSRNRRVEFIILDRAVE